MTPNSGTNWNTWVGRVKVPFGSPLGPGFCSRRTRDGALPGWPRPWMWPRAPYFGTKRRFAETGLAGVLNDRPQAHRYRKLDDRGEAHLIALACSERRQDMSTGPCACWRARWWRLGLAPSLSPRDGAAAPEKNALKPPFCNGAGCGRSRSGASPSERRVRGSYGGSVGPVRRTL